MTDLVEPKVIDPTAVIAPRAKRLDHPFVQIVIACWPLWAWIATLGAAALVIVVEHSVGVTLIACTATVLAAPVLLTLPLVIDWLVRRLTRRGA